MSRADRLVDRIRLSQSGRRICVTGFHDGETFRDRLLRSAALRSDTTATMHLVNAVVSMLGPVDERYEAAAREQKAPKAPHLRPVK